MIFYFVEMSLYVFKSGSGGGGVPVTKPRFVSVASRSPPPRIAALAGGTPVASTPVLCRCVPHRSAAPTGGYLVPLGALVPRLEHQPAVALPALVQTLQLVQVDPPVQSVLQAPLRRLVLAFTPTAVSVAVAVTVAGHAGAGVGAVSHKLPAETPEEPLGHTDSAETRRVSLQTSSQALSVVSCDTQI